MTDHQGKCYKGLKGTTYHITQKLNSGGEGTVYNVLENRQLVAKIYHEKKLASTPQLAEKLQVMVRQPPAGLEGAAFLAWPQDLLYDGTTFVGFIMPRIPSSAKPILMAVRPSERTDLQPRYQTTFSVLVARNLAVMMLRLERENIVLGDGNHENIRVDPNSCIYVIDNDSFIITDRRTNKRFATTDGGVPRYMAPELLDGSGAHYSLTTDRYMIGLWTFMVLMNGVHPFTGTNIEKNIARRQSIFFTGGPLPEEAPRLAWVGPEIVGLFRKSLIGEPAERPGAEAWVQALDRLLLLLKKRNAQCHHDPRHRFVRRYTPTCPFCEVERKKAAAFASNSPVTPDPKAPPAAPKAATAPKAASAPRAAPAQKRTGGFHTGVCYATAVMLLLLSAVRDGYSMLLHEVAPEAAFLSMGILIFCALAAGKIVRGLTSHDYRCTSHPASTILYSIVLVVVVFAAVAIAAALVLGIVKAACAALVAFLATPAGGTALFFIIGGIFLWAVINK